MNRSREAIESAAADAEQIIVGTAGHIDHGKTALVKALTGVDADTLAEEKRRGITIELGFVFMETPDPRKHLVFIDVPGHERLIKTMVAGASSIDAALLVVAADEGVSAQTREHLDILRLLEVPAGVVALTKADLVDDERLAFVAQETRDSLADTFLSDAPIIPVSSVTGCGVEDIRSAVLALADRVRPRPDSGIFRMPVDRVFTMHGFGTVIAGTILSGSVAVADTIELFPDGMLAHVRGIQVHRQNTKRSNIGKRTAINLQDIEKERLRRGQCAAAPGSLTPTNRLDVRLRLMEHCRQSLKNRARLRLHLGTDEVICRLALLDREDLAPGAEAPVQLVLESPTVAVRSERFLVRTFSPQVTIGGGAVLDPLPPRHKRFDPATVEDLARLDRGLEEAVEQAFLKSGFIPRTPQQVALALAEREEEVTPAVEGLCQARRLVKIAASGEPSPPSASPQQTYLHADAFASLGQRLLTLIEEYYARHPYRLLMPLADLQSRFLRWAERPLLDAALADLRKAGRIYSQEGAVGLSGYEIPLKPSERQLAERIEAAFSGAGLAAPLEEEVRQHLGARPETFQSILTGLIDQGRLVRLSDKVTYHREHLDAARAMVTDHLKTHQRLSVAELRDQLGVSRKYALALMEYFDKVGLTRREGDAHVLKQPAGR